MTLYIGYRSDYEYDRHVGHSAKAEIEAVRLIKQYGHKVKKAYDTPTLFMSLIVNGTPIGLPEKAIRKISASKKKIVASMQNPKKKNQELVNLISVLIDEGVKERVLKRVIYAYKYGAE